ncbi:MAG: cell division protein FtsQ/DivIB [Acinetobacter sp.]|nr:cell division protein FtsQ/DivIB [Acinetobacter sp.]
MTQSPFSPRQGVSTLGEQQQGRNALWNMVFGILIVLALIACIVGVFSLQRNLTSQALTLDIQGFRTESELNLIQNQLKEINQQSFYTVDLLQVRNAVLQQDWVDDVVVSRAWPKTIQIHIIPRQAVAQWGRTGRWVSDSGDIFAKYHGRNVRQLPSISGPEDQVKTIMHVYNEASRMFKPMGVNLREVFLTERMTWVLQFDSGLRVIVDQDQPLLKLQRLSQLAQTDLKAVWSKVEAVDLRYRDGLAIQWKDAQPVPYKNGHFILN